MRRNRRRCGSIRRRRRRTRLLDGDRACSAYCARRHAHRGSQHERARARFIGPSASPQPRQRVPRFSFAATRVHMMPRPESGAEKARAKSRVWRTRAAAARSAAPRPAARAAPATARKRQIFASALRDRERPFLLLESARLPSRCSSIARASAAKRSTLALPPKTRL